MSRGKSKNRKRQARISQPGAIVPAKSSAHTLAEWATSKAPTSDGPSKRIVLFYIFGLLFSAGWLFFLSAGLATPFQQLVLQFNDRHVYRSLAEWGGFLLAITTGGLFWLAGYLGLKYFERRLLAVMERPSKDKTPKA